MSRKKKEEQPERQLNIKTIDEIRQDIGKRKPKAKFFDYKNDTLAARKADIIQLIDSEAKEFNNEAIELKKEFLLALTYGNDIKTTAQTMGIGRHRIYKLQENDPAFADCVGRIKKEFEYEKVKDIENELLESKDILNHCYEVLWENGLFKEAMIAIKEANRIKERFVDRYDERNIREEELRLRQEELEMLQSEEQDGDEPRSVPFYIPGGYKDLPNNLSDQEND